MKLKHLLIICRYFKATKNKLSVSSFIVSILFSEGLRLLMHSITLKRITLPSLLKGEVPLDINIILSVKAPTQKRVIMLYQNRTS